MKKTVSLIALLTAIMLLAMLPAASMAANAPLGLAENLGDMFKFGSGCWVEDTDSINGIPVATNDEGKAYITPFAFRAAVAIENILSATNRIPRDKFLIDKNEAYLNGVKLESGKMYQYKGEQFEFVLPGLSAASGESFDLGGFTYEAPMLPVVLPAEPSDTTVPY